MAEQCILYGVPFSLYTGKARSYLIKQGIPYRELVPKTEHYLNDVLPAVHRLMMPTLELPNNEYIQDSTVIIEYFENQPGITSALPETPKQKMIALLFDVMGSEGLLRPAMHYRWNFKEDNDDFLEQCFSTMIPSGIDDPLSQAKKGMDRMRRAAVNFGAKPDSISVIESAYEELLDLLDAHFLKMPYLLGGRPSIGDFGLIAPFYAHLSRDPYPSMMMKKRALRVFRWTERMNRSNQDAGEYSNCPEAFLADDEIPETLKAVIKLLSEDFVPETLAAAACINQWLEKTNPEDGTPVKRGVGLGEFEFRGIKIQALAQPYRFFLLTRMQKAFAGLNESGKEVVRTVFDELGLTPLLSVKINRAVMRHDHLEVWR
ncbi:MAG: glutathione S-transferase [Proteobacteria bacterium]|nr:glutathione S-transferase [Pseudomonadota bacterium]MBU4470787.1 glutathione S-transferase [Pseudomonadota bacterium]MCG2751485.1 glutathione S-transferase [Desulfobacteraceae bacterium]